MTGRSRDEPYQWKMLKRKFRAACRARNALCHICVARGDVEHAQIDYTARPYMPKAFEADHIKPWSTHPHLRFEWGNLAASHSICNRQRRDEQMKMPVSQHEWVKPDW